MALTSFSRAASEAFSAHSSSPSKYPYRWRSTLCSAANGPPSSARHGHGNPIRALPCGVALPWRRGFLRGSVRLRNWWNRLRAKGASVPRLLKQVVGWTCFLLFVTGLEIAATYSSGFHPHGGYGPLLFACALMAILAGT